MSITLSEDFVVLKFIQYAGFATYKRYTKTWIGCCNICREGSSWGHKKRLYYIPKKDLIYCHNCGWSSKPITWISRSSGQSKNEIFEEYLHEYSIQDISHIDEKIPDLTPVSNTLPEDSINLFDPLQIEYFKEEPIVKECIRYIKRRKLDTAINRPESLWISLKDFVHQNRLIIPFYVDGKIEHYQSRAILDDDKIPYLSKTNSTCPVFNLDNISKDCNEIFLFEGPIDSFFTKNGCAVAGIAKDSSREDLNDLQRSQLNAFIDVRKIWVLDSQWLDETSKIKTEILLESGKDVFIWPEHHGKRFKDFNDMCIELNINEIPGSFILKNTYQGSNGKFKLLNIT